MALQYVIYRDAHHYGRSTGPHVVELLDHNAMLALATLQEAWREKVDTRSWSTPMRRGLKTLEELHFIVMDEKLIFAMPGKHYDSVYVWYEPEVL
jgi:hypothetical protein